MVRKKYFLDRFVMSDESKIDVNTSKKYFLIKNLDILYNSQTSASRWEAQKFLHDFQSDSNSWRIIFSMDKTENLNLIHFGITLLDRLVSFSWESLSDKDKKEIQNFLFTWIFGLTSNKNDYTRNKMNIVKFNIVLVKIFCQANKHSFFIYLFDIINSAKETENVCENNLSLILYLHDELFTNQNFEKTKNIYINDFRFEESLTEIKNLCFFVLFQYDRLYSSNIDLLCLSLDTFKKILEISPTEFLIEDLYVEILIILSFKPILGNFSLKCLIEYFGRRNFFFKFSSFKIMQNFIVQFQEMFPLSMDWADWYCKSKQDSKDFMINTSLFFLTFLKQIYKQGKNLFFEKGIFSIICSILLKISCIPDLEIFKICLDCWKLMMTMMKSSIWSNLLKHNFLDKFLYDLKIILIEKMPKPEEVLICEDETGEIIKEIVEETDIKNIHFEAKYVLCYLTEMDPFSSKTIILKKMTNQISHNLWNRNILNRLCWSVGTISGILSKEMENEFLITIIKDLLFLCEVKKGKENKAVIASNIMYVVGQHPRFLTAHFKFLKAVIFKLFEFMHESCPGIKDMACDTFLKIGQNCAQILIQSQENEEKLLFENILDSINTTTLSLELRQIIVFYRAVSFIIDKIENDQKRNFCVSKIFHNFYSKWQNDIKPKLMSKEQHSFLELAKLLKINIEIGKILKKKYYLQIKTLFKETFFLYNWTSEIFNEIFTKYGEKGLILKNVGSLKNLRCEILDIYYLYLLNCILDEKTLFIKENLKTLITPIFLDYKNSTNPNMREHKVLSFCNNLMRIQGFNLDHEFIRLIFDTLFIPSMDMLKKNFEDFPDIRKCFFSLLRVLVEDFCIFIFKLDENPVKAEFAFETIIHGIIWGFKHADPNICDENLKTCYFLLNYIQKENFGDYFYNKFFKQLLNDLISVITDKLHISSLKIQCKLLLLLLQNCKHFLDQNYVKTYLKIIFSRVFPHTENDYLENLVILCLIGDNEKNFKKEIKKLIRSKNSYSDDNSSE